MSILNIIGFILHININGNFATAEELNAIDDKVAKEIEEAIEFAENSPYPDVSILTEDVYA